MRFKRRQFGLSLIEQMAVIAAVAVIIIIAMPMARTLFDSLHTTAGTKSTISSALASARAIAAREQKYAGIRFQHACYINKKGNIEPEQSPLKMPQYMIFVIYQPPKQVYNNDGDVFVAVEGVEPIKLPDNIGVMDMMLGSTGGFIDSDVQIDSDEELLDTTTFFIIFSPSGKLIVREAQTRNRDGRTDLSEDDIFNVAENVQQGVAMFIEDEDGINGLEQEPSRRGFVIYDRMEFRDVPRDDRYEGYLQDLEMFYINPYTGTFIQR